MEFRQYGQVKSNIKATLHPQKDLQEIVFRRLNFLLEFLGRTNSEVQAAFLENLAEVLRSSVKLAHFSDRELEITFLLTHFPYLQPYPNLLKQHMNLFIQILGITESQFWQNLPVVVPYGTWGNSGFRFELLYVRSLADAVGKADALSLYREFQDFFSIEHAESILSFKTLEELREHLIQQVETNGLGKVRTISTIEDGRFIHRCDNCEKVALFNHHDVTDHEVLETLLCYQDFQVTILHNVNFTLTRERTIAGGHSCCDEVYHDQRLVGQAVHPDDTFWREVDKKVLGVQREK
jgi:hypothetical protein